MHQVRALRGALPDRSHQHGSPRDRRVARDGSRAFPRAHGGGAEMSATRQDAASPPHDPERRAFFLAGAVALLTATAGFVASTLRYLVPNVLYEPSRRVTVGRPEDF